MKTATIILLTAVLATPATAVAQSPATPPQKAAEFKQGRRLVIGGATLAVVGLGVLPITASSKDQNGAALAASMAMVSGGAGLAWFGARKMRKAAQPQISFGAAVGPTKGVFVRHAW